MTRSTGDWPVAKAIGITLLILGFCLACLAMAGVVYGLATWE